MFANDARNLSLVSASDSLSPSSDLSSTSDASVAAVELERVRLQSLTSPPWRK